MKEAPKITVLIPARNEEADIERCLRAILAQDHPHDRMEIVVVDGGSTDRTADVATGVLKAGDVDWKIVYNPTGTTPSNLNAGLKVATGDVVCRVDARSLLPSEYVRTCARILAECPNVAVVGGAQVAVPLDASARALGIARALGNPYVMGGARYRRQATSGPDATVYLGSFRTADLRRAGGWDVRFPTNQDFELNRRLGRGGLVWFESTIPVSYLPRRSIRALASQYHRFGRAKVHYWRRTGDRPLPRQRILLCAPLAAAATTAALVSRSRRPAGVCVAAATLAGTGLVVADLVGGGAPAPVSVRMWSLMATVAVAGGWLSGVARGVVTIRGRTGDR